MSGLTAEQADELKALFTQLDTSSKNRLKSFNEIQIKT